MKILAHLVTGTALLYASATFAANAPAVVTSFKPIHSIVASVMQGVGEPGVLIGTNASPHTYTMKPSNAAELEKAKVVFWIGPGFEHFLEKPLEALASGAKSVELSEAPGVELLDSRAGGTFEKHNHAGEEEGEDHDHDHDAEAKADAHDHAKEDAAGKHEHHDDESSDMHLWLDPDNARAMAKEVVKVLSEVDPTNAATYAKNGAALDERLAALDTEIAATLAPVKDRPFIVFHDAYQYMEHHYGLKVAGSIAVNPEVMPGAARIKEIREKVVALGATCVFSEPNFEPKIVKTLIEGTNAKAGELNPEGGALKAGPDLYFELLRANASALKTCLGG